MQRLSVSQNKYVLPHDMFVHEGMAMVGDGEAWFDAKGLAVLNLTSGSQSANHQ
jgi:hypothetical protein